MKPSTIALIVALILAVVASFFLGWTISRHKYEDALNRPDTVLIEKWARDTVYEPRDSFIIMRIPVPLPVHDTTYLRDTTIVPDTVLVDVPIMEKIYYGDNYKATIRGFQPELIDIWVKQTERTITVPYRKRWSFTAGPQVGVGITPGGVQPYAGAGVTFGYSF